jgi:hypothetical protein
MGVLELWDGIMVNSQARVKYEIYLHNQTKMAINASWEHAMRWT